jgi:hypothetical protein
MKPNYAVGTIVNLTTLAIGLALGYWLAHVQSVYARPEQATSQVQQATPQQQPAAPQEVQYEEIIPGVTTGSMAVQTFLAHRIATDELMVNGYDVMALDEGIINLLKNKGIANYRDLDAVIERAKVPHPLRMKVPTQPQPSKPEEKKP